LIDFTDLGDRLATYTSYKILSISRRSQFIRNLVNGRQVDLSFCMIFFYIMTDILLLEYRNGNLMANKAKFLTKFYVRYRSTISLNKNLLLSGMVGFIVSLVVAYVSTMYSANDFTNSAITVIAGFVFSKITFVILFHFDNRKRYTKRFSGKLNLPVLKEIVKKMIFADTVFDIVNNVSRFLILLELLKIDYQPVQAATIASIIASLFSYLAINLIVRRLHVFGSKRKIF
jgi:hypothetical protein